MFIYPVSQPDPIAKYYLFFCCCCGCRVRGIADQSEASLDPCMNTALAIESISQASPARVSPAGVCHNVILLINKFCRKITVKVCSSCFLSHSRNLVLLINQFGAGGKRKQQHILLLKAQGCSQAAQDLYILDPLFPFPFQFLILSYTGIPHERIIVPMYGILGWQGWQLSMSDCL